ncbi:thiol-disulfide oxidoreductase DCC family protein [Streptomyces phytophilus]|uniref:thiol-disulfide oxidoreductase DCC family protein n=1 Tax=Streptomyces phytophilus TaxID=722715 RepID=UPI0015F0DC12|nr:DCC1-like thiol-disulfide oxidoreductase family protein [Streptomyces phytophilus]
MVLLYDGDCGFCTGWADFGRRRFAPEVRIVPWQSVDPEVYGVPEERLLREVVLVDEAGHAPAGPRAVTPPPGGAMAIAGTLRSGNRAGRLLGRALGARPVRRPAAAVYRLVSRNRYRLRFPLLPARQGASCSTTRS